MTPARTKEFIKKVLAELTPHIKNLNPEINDSLFGRINYQIENKDGDLISAIGNIEGKELGEIALQTLIGSGGFVAGGQFVGGTKNIIVD